MVTRFGNGCHQRSVFSSLEINAHLLHPVRAQGIVLWPVNTVISVIRDSLSSDVQMVVCNRLCDSDFLFYCACELQ